MSIVNKNSKKDDQLVFAEESHAITSAKEKNIHKFKLLIVDDENEIHKMTRLVLADFCYKGATLEFISAYSGKEAKTLIRNNPDIACILLDVVMETNDAGLEVARYIREDEKNDRVRIILRTGQPGKAPEKEIILNYDINDYKEKTELTAQKLFTSITTALRSYIHLVELDKKTKEIAEKNIRLNEEIARRIVAESNLTKYNRSLEKMIDHTSSRLKTAILELEKKEKELREAGALAGVGDMSSATLNRLEVSPGRFKENFACMDKYRTGMTHLLEKYETLQEIIALHSDSSDTSTTETHYVMNDIDQFKKEIDLDEILAKYPDIIKDAAKGIETISKAVDDIRMFISIQDEPLKKTDINTLLSTISKKIKAGFSEKIDLQTDFDTVPEINIAEKNIRKAFHEIIKNAFQAVKPHGIVSISTSYEEPDIIILVSDIGCGIAPETLSHIFKPYFTLNKENAKGLGLPFAKSVLMNNNGTINVSSTLNEGTTVTVTLGVEKALS